MAVTSGLGVGGGSAISRRIGARDKAGVDNVALHTFVIMLTLTIVLTAFGLVFLRNLFMYSGAGNTPELGVAYSRVIFGGSFFFSLRTLQLYPEKRRGFKKSYEGNDSWFRS